MSTPRQRTIEVQGLRMQLREQGEGPAVLLCHGFPETSYAWRHQLPALAAAGFRAIAPDLRGYGGTASPQGIERYMRNFCVRPAGRRFWAHAENPKRGSLSVLGTAARSGLFCCQPQAAGSKSLPGS